MGAIQDALNAWGQETVNIIQNNLANTGSNASGQTSASLRSETPQKNRLIVSGRSFLYTVETGRRPGKMPPVSKILEWVNTGKVSFTGSAESFAWAIAKNISKFGTKLFRDGGRTDIITPAISDERIDELTNTIADIALDQTVKVIEDGTKR